MKLINFEFKAKVKNLDELERKLLKLNPEYRGTDDQTDTYFNVINGRLKLREGNIENALINYNRKDSYGTKLSEIILYKHTPDKALKDILTLQLGIKIIVNKKRKIYFINNVKFHFDTIEKLGTFIEVEAIDDGEKFTTDELKYQCNKYFDFFELDKADIIDKSYSDLFSKI